MLLSKTVLFFSWLFLVCLFFFVLNDCGVLIELRLVLWCFWSWCFCQKLFFCFCFFSVICTFLRHAFLCFFFLLFCSVSWWCAVLWVTKAHVDRYVSLRHMLTNLGLCARLTFIIISWYQVFIHSLPIMTCCNFLVFRAEIARFSQVIMIMVEVLPIPSLAANSQSVPPVLFVHFVFVHFCMSGKPLPPLFFWFLYLSLLLFFGEWLILMLHFSCQLMLVGWKMNGSFSLRKIDLVWSFQDDCDDGKHVICYK